MFGVDFFDCFFFGGGGGGGGREGVGKGGAFPMR